MKYPRSKRMYRDAIPTYCGGGGGVEDFIMPFMEYVICMYAMKFNITHAEIHAYTHKYLQVNTLAQVYIYICSCNYTHKQCIDTHSHIMHTTTCLLLYTHINLFIYTYIHVYSHTHVHIYTHVRVYTHIHSYTHAHVHSYSTCDNVRHLVRCLFIVFIY